MNEQWSAYICAAVITYTVGKCLFSIGVDFLVAVYQ
jgi:hypothetical protein